MGFRLTAQSCLFPKTQLLSVAAFTCTTYSSANSLIRSITPSFTISSSSSQSTPSPTQPHCALADQTSGILPVRLHSDMNLGQFRSSFNSQLHAERTLLQLRGKTEPLEKYIFLNGLKERDPNLFYALLGQNLPEFTPLVYTPVIGQACQNYSRIYRRPEGLVVSCKDKGRIREVLKTWPNMESSRIAVVTDGSRILGLGDLGVNGLPISLGKLDLYIAGAGLRPESTLPICLDLGTNTQKYLNDPLYLGLRQKRVGRKEMNEFMEEFMSAMKEVFPKLLVQFEDFSTENAFFYLDAFRDQYQCFNDDIQGTGSVILAGFQNAAKIASSAGSDAPPLTGHRILFYGSGSAGVGVAKQLMSFFTNLGMSQQEARDRIWTVDSKGLIYNGRSGVVEHKKFFARNDYSGPPMKGLKSIIEYVKPTALLGLSTQKNAFTQEVVELMTALNPRPIIFPLSNPSSLCELDYTSAVAWSGGKVVFASGSPYNAVEWQGKSYEPGQGNNMYVFPGIGLGSILSRTTSVTDGMIEKAAMSLAGSLTAEEIASGLIYPRLVRIREVSAKIALGVIRQAQNEEVDQNVSLRTMDDDTLLTHIKMKMWEPPTQVKDYKSKL